MFFKQGVKVWVKAKSFFIHGVVISHEDDSDTQIANVEEYLTIRSDEGTIYSFQGNGSLRPKAKSLRKYGKFYAVPDFSEAGEQHPTATEPPLLECKICNEIVFPSDKFCRHCGVKF